jgi:hypothetical protein
MLLLRESSNEEELCDSGEGKADNVQGSDHTTETEVESVDV